jgi:hypothetical protein
VGAVCVNGYVIYMWVPGAVCVDGYVIYMGAVCVDGYVIYVGGRVPYVLTVMLYM